MAFPGSDSFFLPFLQWLEKNVDLACPLSLKKAEVHTIQLKERFLRVFLTCGVKHNNIEDRHLEALLVHIRTVFQSADLDIRRCWEDLNRILSKKSLVWLPMNMLDLLSSVLQNLELLRPDIHEVYTILSKSSRSTIYRNSEAVMKDLKSLLKNIEDLLICNAEMVAPVKEELEAAQKSLRFLRDLLAFTAKRCSKLVKLNDLLIHADFLVAKMSCLFYLCSVNKKMNDSTVNEMKDALSSELQNLGPSQIYIKALKASKAAQGDSAGVDEFDLGFFDSLRDHILELSDTKLSFIASDKDKFLSLHEELRILIISFAYEDLGYEELDQLSIDFLERISTVIIDMGCLICSLHNNEQNTDEAKEFKIPVSNLQDFIKIAKEDFRKAYYTYVPKTWHLKTKFRTTNAEGMRRSLMRISEKNTHWFPCRCILCNLSRVLQKCFTHKPICHLSKVLQEEMQSLIGAFSNLTAKQHLEHGELEIRMSLLNHIRNETESIYSSLSEESRPDWNHNLWLFFLIEEIKEFKYLQDQMMHDTSTSKTMTDYAEIFEQLINGSKKSHSLPVNVGVRGIDDRNTNLDLICPQKEELKALRLKPNFLKGFLSCKGMWHIEDANLKVLLTRIHSVFQSADQDLQRLWSGLNIQTSPKEVRCLPMNMDCLLSRVLSMLQLLEPDIKRVYVLLLKSSSFITGISDKALLEYLNTLLENIEVLLKGNTEVVAPLKEELEAVEKSLRFLRNFLGFTVKRCSKLGKLKNLLIHSEFLAVKVSCLLYLCCNNEKMNDQMVNEMKMHLSSELQKFRPAQSDVREIYIKALKASKSAKGISNSAVLDEFVLGFLDSLRDDILELSNDNLSFIASNKEQILFLQEELKFLTTFFKMDKSLEERSEHDHISNSLFAHINAVIIDLGCAIYLLNDDENNEMMARELDKKVSDLVANFMAAKAEIRKMYDTYVPRTLRSDFPKTNGQGYIGSLFRNLNELLDIKRDLVAPLKYHIEIVQKELLSLREDFNKIAKLPNQCDELQSQWAHFLDTAYQTEFIVDSFVIGGDPIYCHKLGLFVVVEEIKTIKMELKAIKIKMTNETSVLTQDSVESNFPKNDAVLGFKERLAHEKNMTKLVIIWEEAEKIREQLVTGSKKLNVISIVGMPGIGKTTLADSVFQHSSVTYHFHVQARCSVSQVHDKRRLLLEILQQVTAEKKQYGDDDDVDQKLYKSLKGRRFLILLDDIWNIELWKYIKVCFPDDKNGSRIVFTSRFENIASQAGLESIDFCLSPLQEAKSWEMLQVKLFGNESCPPELVSAGLEIAANCKGLPLTIDLVAGVLRTKERKEWKKVAENLMTILFDDPQRRCRKVLELSYQNLPDDWKTCFLYFAAFPEDANVPTRDLILLWIAEGFVMLEMGERRSLEDEAEDILNNLIRRSLVIVSKRGPLGGVVESRVHDLLHEFAVAKAQEESFMLKIDGKAKYTTLSSVGVHDQLLEQYCLSFDPNPHYWRQFPKSNPSSPRTRALISSDSTWDDFSLSSKMRLAHEKNTTRLVIFGEEAAKIRVQLTNGSRNLNIISIVGMPGIGKTTLADSVFQHSSVTYHFHVRARCSVSQVHDKRRLLLEILQQVTAEKKQYGDDDDVDQKLYKSLKGRRFLILLDDIRNIELWKYIKVCFPDDKNGSRIVFTSRFENIASQAGLESINFCLSPLQEEKSWEMLQVKLFGNESCLPELVSSGHEIAANCKGLPLTIDLIAGILRTKERKEWKKVAENLMTNLFDDPQRHCWKVLELSYQNLPDDWKPCFLYFAAFPEDVNLPTRRLIWLWIVEGFVMLEKGETRSLEDKAEDILNNLTWRSLVTVSKRGPLGGVVESRVHDLLHEFSVAKLQEESFMPKKDDANFSTVGVHDQRQDQYRLCIYPNYRAQFLGFQVPWVASSLNYNGFKLLRVLYIPEALSRYCPEVFTLIHLRLLAISIFIDSEAHHIMSNIHKLWNLETFITYRQQFTKPDENLLLDKICEMVRLRHFCFEGYINFRYLREEIWQKASFANLQTLYNLKASYDEDIEKILKLMPNIVELKVLFYNPDGDCYPFPKLDFLKKLKSLEVTHRGSNNLCPCNFPPYLKQLVLSNFQVPWMEISDTGNLEYLEVLELKKGAFRGPIWDMINGQFPKLKYLLLSDMDIEEWNASEDHLSCLEQLHVSRCIKLKELPSCLEQIATLQAIKLIYCTKSVEYSAQRIKEEQEEMGNEQLVIDITWLEDP